MCSCTSTTEAKSLARATTQNADIVKNLPPQKTKTFLKVMIGYQNYKSIISAIENLSIPILIFYVWITWPIIDDYMTHNLAYMAININFQGIVHL